MRCVGRRFAELRLLGLIVFVTYNDILRVITEW